MELAAFDRRLTELLYQHLRIFAIWSLSSLGVAFFGFYYFQNAAWYFALMTLCWAIVNLGVLWWLYYHVRERKYTQGTVLKRLEVQTHVQKMFLLNVGLDVLYAIIGYLFLVYVNNLETEYPDLFEGFAWAIMLQGAYLFCQDLFFYYLHRQHSRRTRPLLKKMASNESI